MSTNKKYFFLKISAAFTESGPIQVLESEPDGGNMIYLLQKLYLLSLKNEGRLSASEDVPYDTALLARIMRCSEELMSRAMREYERLGLMTVLPSGVIYMNGLEELVGSGSTEGDRKRAYRRRLEEERQRCAVGDRPGTMSHLTEAGDNGDNSGTMSRKNGAAAGSEAECSGKIGAPGDNVPFGADKRPPYIEKEKYKDLYSEKESYTETDPDVLAELRRNPRPGEMPVIDCSLTEEKTVILLKKLNTCYAASRNIDEKSILLRLMMAYRNYQSTLRGEKALYDQDYTAADGTGKAQTADSVGQRPDPVSVRRGESTDRAPAGGNGGASHDPETGERAGRQGAAAAKPSSDSARAVKPSAAGAPVLSRRPAGPFTLSGSVLPRLPQI